MKLPVLSETLPPQEGEQQGHYQNATIICWGHPSSIVPDDAIRAPALLAIPEWISRVLYCFSEGCQEEQITVDAMQQSRSIADVPPSET
jgi:hypothetical protein